MDWNGIKDWITAEGTGHWFFVAFPIALLCLFIMLRGRRVRFLIPSLLMTIVIVNPVFYKIWDQLGLYAYWRILWIVPVIPVVGCVVPMITERIQWPWVKGIGAAVGIGAIVLSGTLLYSGPGGRFVRAANAAKLPEDVVQIADRLLELEKLKGQDGQQKSVRVVAQHPLGVYMRQYCGEIDQLYGRDLDGYILGAKADARNVHNALSDGNMTAVATAMANDQYEYLVVNADKEETVSGSEYEVIDHVANYSIYRAHGKPSVIKERNELGQVVSITTVDENGKAKNNEFSFATVEWEYDSNGHISSECTLDADKNPIAAYRNYAEIRFEYENNNVVKESYFDIDGNSAVQDAGHVAISQEWDGNKLISRTYLDSNGDPMNRVDGYSKVDWSRGNVMFYNIEGVAVELDGINLYRERKVDSDGWSEWFTPKTDMVNYCISLGSVNLGEKHEGDKYSCQVEIEFKDVTAASDDGSFWLRAQGNQDGRWYTGNVWNDNLVSLHDVPTDGIYKFSSTTEINETMADVRSFEIAFRCDNWGRGSFRVRDVKIEKGNTCSEWSHGI